MSFVTEAALAPVSYESESALCFYLLVSFVIELAVVIGFYCCRSIDQLLCVSLSAPAADAAAVLSVVCIARLLADGADAD